MARGSHGVVTRRRLLAAGMTSKEIDRCLRSGVLIQVHRGVYRVGHVAPSVEADYLAAVLACGDGAVLSGRAAAWLHGLIRGAAPAPEVTAPRERRVRGVTVHRSRRLDRRDVTRARGIPVTTVPRTLVDLAPTVSRDALARACHEAGVRYDTTPRQVDEVLRRRPNAPGAANLRAVMRGDAKVTLSELERRFLERLRAAGLPLPHTNRPAGGRRVDCRWPDRALTVELDSYRFHNSRHAWEQDRRRDREARARGDLIIRYTWADVEERPAPMLAELRPLLLTAPAAPPARRRVAGSDS